MYLLDMSAARYAHPPPRQHVRLTCPIWLEGLCIILFPLKKVGLANREAEALGGQGKAWHARVNETLEAGKQSWKLMVVVSRLPSALH